MSVDGRLRNGLSHDASGVDVDVEGFLGDVVRRGRRQRRLRRIGAIATTTAMIIGIVAVAPIIRNAIRDQTTQPVAPVPPEAIEGTYAVRIAPGDTTGLDVPSLDGLWQLTLRRDGLLTAQGPPATQLSTPPTQYHVDGDQLMTTAFESGTCSGVGVYRWSRQGSTLVLTLVSDACAVRVALFTAHPWEAR
jgi:hypothetical protein